MHGYQVTLIFKDDQPDKNTQKNLVNLITILKGDTIMNVINNVLPLLLIYLLFYYQRNVIKLTVATLAVVIRRRLTLASMLVLSSIFGAIGVNF